jgi:hypothetical protein
VGTQDYYARLGQSLNDAEAVLVLNPVIAAMLEPYSSRVRIVPWGMDTARFPWAVAEGPQAGETGRAAPGADGAGEEERPAVGPEGGVERPAPSATCGRAGGRGRETRAQRGGETCGRAGRRGRETRAQRGLATYGRAGGRGRETEGAASLGRVD